MATFAGALLLLQSSSLSVSVAATTLTRRVRFTGPLLDEPQSHEMCVVSLLMAQAAAVPSWNGPALDYTKPLGGLKLVPGAQHVEVYHGDDVYGG